MIVGQNEDKTMLVKYWSKFYVKLIILWLSICKGLSDSVFDCETDQGKEKDMRNL